MKRLDINNQIDSFFENQGFKRFKKTNLFVKFVDPNRRLGINVALHYYRAEDVWEILPSMGLRLEEVERLITRLSVAPGKSKRKLPYHTIWTVMSAFDIGLLSKNSNMVFSTADELAILLGEANALYKQKVGELVKLFSEPEQVIAEILGRTRNPPWWHATDSLTTLAACAYLCGRYELARSSIETLRFETQALEPHQRTDSTFHDLAFCGNLTDLLAEKLH